MFGEGFADISTFLRSLEKSQTPAHPAHFVPMEGKSVFFSWNPNQFASCSILNSKKEQFKSKFQGCVGLCLTLKLQKCDN